MSDESSTKAKSYTVVARRYRPQTFAELIGQEHVAQALSNAISHEPRRPRLPVHRRPRRRQDFDRPHLRQGAELRPKERNLPQSHPATTSTCSRSTAPATAASTRSASCGRTSTCGPAGRASRSTSSTKSTCSRREAFNALLKTLEEPPEHVKFIFCTTEADKIPITILSRCQRFDFAPAKSDAIHQRLGEICAAEGVEAEAEALAMLARRAAGSMRDSQSLLEQLMSFSPERITVTTCMRMLGTADEGRLIEMVEALRNRSPLDALAVVDQATRGGADPGQLAEQLLNYLRDVMTAGIGGGPELLKLANPAGHARLTELAKDWGLQTILSAIQILDESLVRMRSSVSSTTLLEVALVQICQLQDLALIPAMIDAIIGGGPMPTTAQRPPERIANSTISKPADEKKNAEQKVLATPVESSSSVTVAKSASSGQHLSSPPVVSSPPASPPIGGVALAVPHASMPAHSISISRTPPSRVRR